MCVCVSSCLNVRECACVCDRECVFVFTPVGFVIFAPNYLQHKSTVGAFPWQPAVGLGAGNGSMRVPELFH